MTATVLAATMPATPLPAWTIGTPRLLAGLDRYALLDYEQHLTQHGPNTAPTLLRLVNAAEQVSLAGRGGAGFAVAAKLRALRAGRPVVVVNGSESEPASRKDRLLLQRTPHLVVDGALAVAAAISAVRVIIAVGEQVAEASLRAALRQRPDGPSVEVYRSDAGFVAGEARALVRAIGGGPALPPGRRQHATDRGVGGAPTLVFNAETFAQLAVLLRLGPAAFRASGTHAEPGTALLTVGGAVARPGVVELPLGTPLGIVLAAAGARNPTAVVIGGYHGGWHLPTETLPMSRAGLAAAGGTFGAGVLLVLDDSTCPLGELARVTGWLAAQSANQCGPCRFGLPALAGDIERLWHGQPAAGAAATRHVHTVTGRGACVHPDGTARFATSGLRLLRDDVDAHSRAGGCGRPVRGLLPVPR
jgi:NADH:ubiquinone oxidoreductase subunit F (NADH-binding)